MDTQARDFLTELLNTPSPTGFETAGQRVWADYVRPYVDGVEADTYGSVWAERSGGGGPRLMLEAHADEIGFMVQHVTEEGYLNIVPVGGSDRAIMRARRVYVLAGGERIGGVIGHTAIHLRDRDDEKVPKWEDLYVDIGASSADEVRERGVRVGHPIVLADEAEELMPGRLVGRAIDNRIGGFIVAETLRRLSDREIAASVVGVNAVQEEIGGHGAQMITHRLRPDVALVFDVTHSVDTPGLSKAKHGGVKMGGGPTVTHGTSNQRAVVERLIEVAAQHDIPLQHEASSRRTGTDTDSIFNSRSGVASALVSVPLRYMHSPAEVVDLEDVERCIQLFVAFSESIADDDEFTTRL